MSQMATMAVSRRFGAEYAVREVAMAVEPGEVVGLLGANGAGKTTLIRLALGLLRPTAGTVTLFGSPPSRDTRRRLGYVPQSLGLYEDLTVAENLAFAARAFGHRVVAARLDPEIRASARVLVRDLSLGLRRRVAFAAALAHDPELLVLDEPTSGVEPLARARLWETVRAGAERGAGVLATTHHMSEASECDRLVVMVSGRVVASGSAAAIMGGMQTVVVTAVRWEDAFAALDDRGLPVALVGRRLRIPDRPAADVDAALRGAEVEARLEVVPATFEEAFVALARQKVA
ncbi:MAG: ABC transporter ATP-binding protein [Chloroflexi bacterium]|nr:MAG: ABC transporter ATP-binding protein [Chloroflexota bacterium]